MKLDGNKIREARERLALSINAASEEAGMSPQTWLRAEHGGELRSISVRRIARVLDLKPEELFPGKAAAPQGSGQLEEGGAKELSEEDRETYSDITVQGFLDTVNAATTWGESLIEDPNNPRDDYQFELIPFKQLVKGLRMHHSGLKGLRAATENTERAMGRLIALEDRVTKPLGRGFNMTYEQHMQAEAFRNRRSSGNANESRGKESDRGNVSAS